MSEDAYNYEHFPPDMDDAVFARFPSVLRVGERAPDGEVFELATGARRPLSAYWRERPVMIEFGSVT